LLFKQISKTMAEELDLTNEPLEDVADEPIQLSEVTEQDKFKLAKRILLACLLVYIGIIFLFAFSRQFCITEPMKEVWAFSSQGLFGIINLIIGFYFGGKIAANKS
jgi:uncharacterized membrane protein (DUF485 family)